MSRNGTLIIHTVGTVAALALMSLAVYQLWFPYPYWRGLGLPMLLGFCWLVVIGVGPLLTFVVFKPGKRGLAFDLSMIGIIQALAFAGSFWFVYQVRPVFVVFAVDRFTVVQAYEVELAGAKYEQFKFFPTGSPIFAVGKVPSDINERSELLNSALNGQGDVENFASFYHPFEPPHTDAMLARVAPVAELLAQYPEMRTEIERLPIKGLEVETLKFLPLRMREQDMTAIVHPVDGHFLGAVEIDPWAGPEQLKKVIGLKR